MYTKKNKKYTINLFMYLITDYNFKNIILFIIFHILYKYY